MDYSTVNLVAVAKLHSTLCEKREIKFQMTHRGQTYRVYKLVYCGNHATEHSEAILPSLIQTPVTIAAARHKNRAMWRTTVLPGILQQYKDYRGTSSQERAMVLNYSTGYSCFRFQYKRLPLRIGC